MQTVTLRLSKEAEQAIREVMENQGVNTGSKALAIALNSFVRNQESIRNQWALISDLKDEIRTLKATIEHLR